MACLALAQQESNDDNKADSSEQELFIGATHSIVTYLGNDFILKDGCPLQKCNARDR